MANISFLCRFGHFIQFLAKNKLAPFHFTPGGFKGPCEAPVLCKSPVVRGALQNPWEFFKAPCLGGSRDFAKPPWVSHRSLLRGFVLASNEAPHHVIYRHCHSRVIT